jgi:large subunit ribosomal protein L31
MSELKTKKPEAKKPEAKKSEAKKEQKPAEPKIMEEKVAQPVQPKQPTQSKTVEAKPKKAPASGHHPIQHKINVVMTDGTKFQILSTWGKEGDTLNLDVDTKNHPAWQEKGQNFINANNERVTKFKNKFGDFNFVSGKKS